MLCVVCVSISLRQCVTHSENSEERKKRDLIYLNHTAASWAEPVLWNKTEMSACLPEGNREEVKQRLRSSQLAAMLVFQEQSGQGQNERPLPLICWRQWCHSGIAALYGSVTACLRGCFQQNGHCGMFVPVRWRHPRHRLQHGELIDALGSFKERCSFCDL